MSFNSKSRDYLNKLSKQLGKEDSQPNQFKKNQKKTIAHKLHPIETEEDPERLFQELMKASPDGTVPKHLMDRLKSIEKTDALINRETSKNRNIKAEPDSKKIKSSEIEIEEEKLYIAFRSLLLEED